MTYAKQQCACDLIVTRAAELMVEECGASIPMLLDRMLTYAAAQATVIDGTARTAENFRIFADKIESGLFDHLVSGQGRGRKN